MVRKRERNKNNVSLLKILKKSRALKSPLQQKKRCKTMENSSMFLKKMTILMNFPFFFFVVIASPSKTTFASENLCKRVMKISDPDHPEYILKEFCDGDTLRCTDTLKGKGMASHRVKSICEDPRRCTNPVIAKACQDECSDKKTKVSLHKKKTSEKSSPPSNQCHVQLSMFQALSEKRPNSSVHALSLIAPSSAFPLTKQ